jgi:arabinosaccharide transport system substrate-binding protein
MRNTNRSSSTLWRRAFLSTGGWIIVAIAVVSSAVILIRPSVKSDGLQLWTSAREHFLMYQAPTQRWNLTAARPVNLYLFSDTALGYRMMSGFLSGVPVADLIEVERRLIGPVFAGPLEDVGFVDLTDRLKSEGLLDQINRPSFSPWTSRGHIFGLPHDVHPVMLGYRADLVEAAGIDVSKIETWDDFAQVMRPLLSHLGPDGQPDHYPLNIWYTSLDQIETLILQAGGGYFDEQERPIIDSAVNAHVIATIVSWTLGPARIAADAPEFTASGNELRLSGFVVCSIMPDWLGGIWKSDIPGLSGKLKLMPLPAWTRGGRRTSVWGGTMLGICKGTHDFESAWAFAKHLYLSEELAHTLYQTNDIISPIKRFWNSPMYDAPDPFFSGQAPGRLYIAQAPNVPLRNGSPFNSLARLRVEDAVVDLRRYAEAHDIDDETQLEPQARLLLKQAESTVRGQMEKDVFLSEAP